MKKMTREESRKLKTCKIHLPQTARQMNKGTQREKFGETLFKKDFLKIPFI